MDLSGASDKLTELKSKGETTKASVEAKLAEVAVKVGIDPAKALTRENLDQAKEFIRQAKGDVPSDGRRYDDTPRTGTLLVVGGLTLLAALTAGIAYVVRGGKRKMLPNPRVERLTYRDGTP